MVIVEGALSTSKPREKPGRSLGSHTLPHGKAEADSSADPTWCSASALANFGTLNVWPNLPTPLFPYLQNGANNISFIGLYSTL